MSEVILTAYCLAYNHEKYIRKTLEGFVNQKTDYKYKVIVHDDASTDSTPQIIQEYADKYPDIIVPILQIENQYISTLKFSLQTVGKLWSPPGWCHFKEPRKRFSGSYTP